MIDLAKPFDCQIRAMELDDVPRVREIDIASFSLPWSERSYRFEVQGNPASHCYVAELSQGEGQAVIAGMIVVWHILDEAHVGTIAIDQPYRRLGLGRRLLAEALLDADNHGIQVSYLEVRRSNIAAQALYEQFGFKIAGVRPHYYKDNGEDAFLMTLAPIQPTLLEQLRQMPLAVHSGP